MKISEMFPSKYLSKEDFTEQGSVHEIAYHEQVPVRNQDTGKDEMKNILHFNGLDKPLILNVTNANLVGAIVGEEDADNWGGKQIRISNDPSVMFKGKRTGGIKVSRP